MKKIWICLLLVVFSMSVVGCDVKEQESSNDNQIEQSNKQEDTNAQEEEKDNLGYVEKETVDAMVTKFNTKIVNDSGLGPVSTDEVSLKDSTYRYEITDGLSLIVVPETMTDSASKDIVSSMAIYIEKDYQDDPQGLAYARLLIMTNNPQISYDEAQALIEEAQTLKSQQLTSNNGKGISVRYLEADTHLEYQIIRNYQ